MVPAVDWLIAGAAADSGDEVQRMGDRHLDGSGSSEARLKAVCRGVVQVRLRVKVSNKPSLSQTSAVIPVGSA